MQAQLTDVLSVPIALLGHLSCIGRIWFMSDSQILQFDKLLLTASVWQHYCCHKRLKGLCLICL
jgi:hypothetical protein